MTLIVTVFIFTQYPLGIHRYKKFLEWHQKEPPTTHLGARAHTNPTMILDEVWIRVIDQAFPLPDSNG